MDGLVTNGTAVDGLVTSGIGVDGLGNRGSQQANVHSKMEGGYLPLGGSMPKYSTLTPVRLICNGVTRHMH